MDGLDRAVPYDDPRCAPVHFITTFGPDGVTLAGESWATGS